MSEGEQLKRWAANHRAAAERSAQARRAELLTPDAYLDRAFEVIDLANEWSSTRPPRAEVPEEDLRVYRDFARLRANLGIHPGRR